MTKEDKSDSIHMLIIAICCGCIGKRSLKQSQRGFRKIYFVMKFYIKKSKNRKGSKMKKFLEMINFLDPEWWIKNIRTFMSWE